MSLYKTFPSLSGRPRIFNRCLNKPFQIILPQMKIKVLFITTFLHLLWVN